MIRIDDTLLEEIGLIALPKQERDQLLRQIYETLEMRVGMRLAERMTDQQLDEFERFIDTNDEAGALKWLESNFPDYKQVVADELEKLKGEIKQDSSKILQTMQTQQLPQTAPAPATGAQPAAPNTWNAQPQHQPMQATQPFAQPVAPQQNQFAAPDPVAQPQQFQPAQQPVQPFQPQAPSVAQPQSNPVDDSSQTGTTQPQQDSQSVQNIPPPPLFS